MNLDGETKLVAVIGDPVKHSRSPAIHNSGFAELGLNYAFLALEVPKDEAVEAVSAMRTLGLAGLSVTMPHKQDVAKAVDALSPTSQKLGVCNCIYWDGEELVGHSTDGDGFVASLNEQLANSFSFQGAKVAVVGAGGAARSIIEALGRNGVEEISVINRSIEKAETCIELASQARVGVAETAIRSADLIVNATAVGMAGGPAPDSSPLDTSLISKRQVVADIVYGPSRTPLLEAAEDIGATTVGGLGMLVHQAALSFELWTGSKAPVDVMTASVM